MDPRKIEPAPQLQGGLMNWADWWEQWGEQVSGAPAKLVDIEFLC